MNYIGNYRTAVSIGAICRLDQFIEAVADAATGEFERLKEFGIKARVQGDEIRFIFRGTETTVRNSAQSINSFLEQIGETDFASGMSDQMDTLEGSFSNMEDSVGRLARAFGESGLNALVRNLTGKITAFSSAMADALQNGEGFLAAIGGGIAESVRGTDQDRLGVLSKRSLALDSRIIKLRQLPGERDAIGIIEAQRARVEREIKGLLTVMDTQPGSSVTGGAGTEAANPAAGADGPSRKVVELGERLIAQLERQKALFGATSAAAEIRYELERGKLKELEPEHKARALAIAGELDALEAAADLEERQSKEREKQVQIGKREAEQAKRAQERHMKDLKARVEGLRESTLTEIELEDERHRRALTLLDKAQAEKLDSIANFHELRARLEQQHEDNLSEIRKRANAEEDRKLQAAAQRQAEIFQEPFKNALRGIQGSFTSFYEKLFRGGVDSFKDLASSAKDIFIRLAAEIATLLTFRPIVGGILGSVGATGLASSLGLGGSVGAAGGGGGLLSGGSLGSLGSSILSPLLGVGNFLQGLQVKGAVGIGNLLLGAGVSTNFASNVVGNLSSPGFPIAGLLGGLAGGALFGGKGSTGGSLGASLGFAVGGPIGGIIGALGGGFLGGLFGGKPSRETSVGRLVARGGKFTSIVDGGKAGNAVSPTLQALANQLNQEMASRGLRISENQTFVIAQIANAGAVGDSNFKLQNISPELRIGAIANVGPGSRQLSFNSAQDIFSAILPAVLQSKATTPDPNSKAPGSAAAASTQARALLDAADVTKVFANQVRAVIDQFTELRQNARALGISISEINRVEEGQLETLKRSQTAQLRAVVQQGRQVLGIPALEALQQELSFGALSNVSPVVRFGRARTELDTLGAAALAGDLDAIGRFPGLAQSVLQLGRETFASGPEFQSLFRSVNTTLNDVLAKQRDLEMTFTADLTIALRDNADDQIAALKDQTKALTTALNKIETRLKKIA